MPTKKTRVTDKARKTQQIAKMVAAATRPAPARIPSPVPVFDPEGPPKDWERQHAVPRGRTILGVPTWNQGARPVPRQASCHFYQVRSGNSTFYFI